MQARVCRTSDVRTCPTVITPSIVTYPAQRLLHPALPVTPLVTDWSGDLLVMTREPAAPLPILQDTGLYSIPAGFSSDGSPETT